MLFGILLFLPSCGNSANSSENGHSFELLRRAGEHTDYADYHGMAKILGFDVVNVHVKSSAIEADTVKMTHVDFSKTSRSPLSSAAEHIALNSFAYESGMPVRASFGFILDSDRICLRESNFLAHFPGAVRLKSSDGAAGYSSRFDGVNSRSIWASFDANGCVATVGFVQN